MTYHSIHFNETLGVLDVVGVAATPTGGHKSSTRVQSDTLGIVGLLGTKNKVGSTSASIRSVANSVGVAGVLDAPRLTMVPRVLTDSVDITDYLAKRWQLQLADTVGTDSVAISIGTLVQYDTWRPIPRPDNKLILACRTPVGDHDTTLTDITLWTFQNDGSYENVVREIPSVYSWTTYGHPEWSPDGTEVVIYAEDSTTYALVVLDATGFDRAES